MQNFSQHPRFLQAPGPFGCLYFSVLPGLVFLVDEEREGDGGAPAASRGVRGVAPGLRATRQQEAFDGGERRRDPEAHMHLGGDPLLIAVQWLGETAAWCCSCCPKVEEELSEWTRRMPPKLRKPHGRDEGGVDVSMDLSSTPAPGAPEPPAGDEEEGAGAIEEPKTRSITHKAIRRARGAAKLKQSHDAQRASVDETDPLTPGAKYEAAPPATSEGGDDPVPLCVQPADSQGSEMGAATGVGDALAADEQRTNTPRQRPMHFV